MNPLEEEFERSSAEVEPDVRLSELSLSNNNNNNNSISKGKKKKISDEEVIERLKGIVSSDDPNKKYMKLEKIGQGYSIITFTH